MRGKVFKRCRCTDDQGKDLNANCPQLHRPNGSYNPKHGTWYFTLEQDGKGTGRPRVRRGGFESKDAAQDALDEAERAAARGVDISRRHTLETYLRDEWLPRLTQQEKARNTLRSYTQHCETLWIPQLGHRYPKDIRRTDVEDALETLTTSAATKQRYRATLRAALNDMMRDHLVDVNVAQLARIPSGKAPKARVWTAARVLQFEAELETRIAAARDKAHGQEISVFKIWRDMSLRPSTVMVWTPGQVGRFLDHAQAHKWYALFHVIAFRGLRRGEACGIRVSELDLEARVLPVNWQITKGGGVTEETTPKSDDSDAAVSLDTVTVDVLREHMNRRAEMRAEWGPAWTESGYVFTREDGSKVDPDQVYEAFLRLAFDAGCPPIRLHDLRHSAASIMHRAGIDNKTISSTLRHATTSITDDIYTSVFEEVDHEAAEAAAAVVPLRRRSSRSDA